MSTTTLRTIAAAAMMLAGTALVPAASATASQAPWCSNHALRASYHHQRGGEGMNQYWGWIVLRNASDRTCRTGGFGGISYVGHGNGTQIGAAATRQGRYTPISTLRPGQRVRSLIDETNAGVYDRSRCRPTHVDGFRVYVPNATRSQYVKHPRTGCANASVKLLTHKSYRRP